MPEELWMEVHSIVHEVLINTIPKKKECKKAKWLYSEALQIAEKKREVNSKGQKERYTHMNEEFQRTARRDKQAFFSDQCKEIQENNRMEKTRDLFKKIRDTKGTFPAKMGTIKDRNDMDLTEAEDIKKRWQEYTEELYRKDLNEPDNHDGLITHLEPDIPGVRSQTALGKHHKIRGCGGILAELFQILKDDAVKLLQLNGPANLENSAVATGLARVSFHSNPKERQCQNMFKLPHNCTHLICWQSNAQNSPSQASTVCEP